MLSNHERKTLREVERQFLDEDPGFTRSFDTRAQRLRREHLDGVSTKIAVVAAVLLGALMLVVGSLGGALAIVTVTGLIWPAWRYSDDPRRTST